MLHANTLTWPPDSLLLLDQAQNLNLKSGNTTQIIKTELAQILIFRTVEEDVTVIYTLMPHNFAIINSVLMHDARPGSVLVAVLPSTHFLFRD